MTEFQRDRQAEQPRGMVRVHAHLHGLSLPEAVEVDEANRYVAEVDDDDDMDVAIGDEPDIGDFSNVDTSDDEVPAKPPRVDGNPYDTEFARLVTAGLQDKAIYQQTLQADVIAHRRRRNRAARQARRIERAS